MTGKVAEVKMHACNYRRQKTAIEPIENHEEIRQLPGKFLSDSDYLPYIAKEIGRPTLLLEACAATF